MSNLRDRYAGNNGGVETPVKVDPGMAFEDSDFLMSQEQVEVAARSTQGRSVKLSREDKIKINCSHRGRNGQPLIQKRKVQRADIVSGKTIETVELVCPLCKEIIQPMTQVYLAEIKDKMIPMIADVCNYIKAFDDQFNEPTRQILATFRYESLVIFNVLENVIRANTKKKVSNGKRSTVANSNRIFK
ncbi:MAG: hypothetical protein ACRCX2_07750 [Paraclostridium sp.]